jgi:two-component system nitrogen regulation sensor histidine kinase NtrY
VNDRHYQDAADDHGRRLYWEAAIILATALAVVLLALSLTRLPQLSDTHNLAGNAVFVLLINLNIVLLILLVFLVARNLIKLFYDRRRKLLGAHLRFRLVSAFVAIALFPAILLFLVGTAVMSRSLESVLTNQVEKALEGSLAVVSTFYDLLGGEALSQAQTLATEIAQNELLAPDRRRALQELVETRREMLHLGRVMVLSPERTVLANSTIAELQTRERSGLEAETLDRVFRREHLREVRAAENAQTEVVLGGVPVIVEDDVVGAVVVEYFVPRSIARQSSQVVNAFREYLHLRILKHPMKTNYIVTMSLVTLVAVFSAVWLGLFLAKKITVPLQRLAAGTREVARGHWTYRIEGEDEDEIGTLVAAFNRMTGELQLSHQELEARRRYMEIVLANITAGVVTLDRHGVVTTINPAAERLLGLTADEAIGQGYHEVFPLPDFDEVRRMVGELLSVSGNGAGNGVSQSLGQMKLRREGQVFSLVMTGALLTDEQHDILGTVCFFEDVTQIVRVERMEAWREVARRIAHEIKNPLTPIQLAAQRLHRRFAPQITTNAEVFNECVNSIAHEVDTIKKLVNEFSTFARLPTADHVPENLNALIQEVLPVFTEAHRDIVFVFTPDKDLPMLELDREGMKRILRNLLDNAVAACRAVPNGAQLQIVITTRLLWSVGIVQLEVADSGGGIPPEVKDRVFEPYFSTKREGTGLGLAIVATIVADHQAFIRVRDNYPHGSRFIIELPARRKARRTQTAHVSSKPVLQGANGKGEEGEGYGRDHLGGG